MSENPYRLPRTVVPTRYDLRLEPDLETHTFQGRETVELEIAQPVNEIVLNSLEIEIRKAVLHTDQLDLVAEVSYDEQAQRAILGLNGTAPDGPATLELEFSGILNDQLHGFYRSKFTDVDGVEQTIATTQFEATDARRAFPCWDEPDFKAVFGVTLVVPDHLMAISNGAEADRMELGDGKVAVRFADTMKMSTYLVAFVVGPFEATDPVYVDDVPVRVVAPRGKLHLAGWALECAEFCLRYLGDYYGIPYPGDKVDHIAIPDFAFGAMENLGAITYRETALLVDLDTASQADLVRILDVIGHELAHMWFGDLVTMGWWDGIWLNEAFATFMEMKSTDAMRPDWKRWLAFGADERPWSFRVDALRSTRPVEFEVTSPDEAQEMFDALTYGKGSSVLRMIEQFLGEERFREGVGTYLRRHSHGNTVTKDLWKGLDDASGEPAGEIMDTWILQRGYPQVEVSETDGGVRLRQRRFLSIPDDTDVTTWKIPIQVRGASDGRPFHIKTLLETETDVIEIEGPIDWLVGNAGGHGYYRVVYSETLAKSLRSNLDQLEDLERYTVIDDAWAFVESGQIPASAFLEMATAYRDESEYSVWQAVIGGLASLKHHVVSNEDLPAFRERTTELLSAAIERVGWEPQDGESGLDRRLRGLLLGAAGRIADDPDTIDRSRDVAQRWIADRRSADPDVAHASLFTFCNHGSDEDYRKVYSAYQAEQVPQTKQKFLQGITFFDGEAHVDRTIAGVLDGTIRNQDSAWVVARLFGRRRSGPHAWQKVRQNWEDVTAKMPPMTLRHMVEGVSALSQPEVEADVQAFLSEIDLPIVEKTAQQALERLRMNGLLRQRETDRLVDYLLEGR